MSGAIRSIRDEARGVPQPVIRHGHQRIQRIEGGRQRQPHHVGGAHAEQKHLLPPIAPALSELACGVPDAGRTRCRLFILSGPGKEDNREAVTTDGARTFTYGSMAWSPRVHQPEHQHVQPQTRERHEALRVLGFRLQALDFRRPVTSAASSEASTYGIVSQRGCALPEISREMTR